MNFNSGFGFAASRGFVSFRIGGLQPMGHKDSVWSLQHHAYLPLDSRGCRRLVHGWFIAGVNYCSLLDRKV